MIGTFVLRWHHRWYHQRYLPHRTMLREDLLQILPNWTSILNRMEAKRKRNLNGNVMLTWTCIDPGYSFITYNWPIWEKHNTKSTKQSCNDYSIGWSEMMLLTIRTPGKSHARKNVTGFCASDRLLLISTSVSSPVSRSLIVLAAVDDTAISMQNRLVVQTQIRTKDVFTFHISNFVV